MFALWVLIAFMVIACGVCVFFTWNSTEMKKPKKIMLTCVASVVTLLVTAGCVFMMYFTVAGQRSWKTLISNVAGNIDRVVTVYDMNGEVITTYEGNFDIDSNETRIMFDDQDGKRHTIYWTTGTVVIDEK